MTTSNSFTKRAGVLGVFLSESEAQLCGDFLRARWISGSEATIAPGVTLTGPDGYGQSGALLIPPWRLNGARSHMPGFRKMEQDAIERIKRLFGLDAILHSARGEKHGPATFSSSDFGWHQDDEEARCIHLTASVKLTPDSPGDVTSKIAVAGARDTFEYGALRGSAAIFFACLSSSVVPPVPQQQDHLKMVFFFTLVTNPMNTSA